jgi:lysophospholipase L1-like esterase
VGRLPWPAVLAGLGAILICLAGDLSLSAQPVSGGFLRGGLDGAYFANPDLAGAPSFVRRDARVDFDWGTQLKPGGSRGPGFVEVGVDQFSVRWTGQFSPRFGETYTFRLVADDGARLRVKGAMEPAFTTLIDTWFEPGAYIATLPLAERQTYDIVLEYRELTGAAQVSLFWSCPSAPEEVMEAASLAAINIETYTNEVWANAMDSSRDEWRDQAFSSDPALWPSRDTNGWPLSDGTVIVWEGRLGPTMAGHYLLQFKGRAQVRAGSKAGQFWVDGTEYGDTLPAEVGWDPAANMTTVILSLTNADILYLEFSDTRREPGDTTPTGVCDVRLMRPISVGSTNFHTPGALFGEDLKRALGRYHTVRWAVNHEKERIWAERVRPAYSTHLGLGTKRFWEHMILLANETGKDLYACLPQGADDDYVLRVARMLRYGSDGVDPYATPQDDPVFPPLNPNLRVYLERSNEIWNWAGSQASESAAQGRTEVQNNTLNGQILNFDGLNPNGDNFSRWHALRTVQMSDLFRVVWGEAAMGDRIRFLLEYEHDNVQNTAGHALDFLDRFFNNADGGMHVPEPHPVKHYLWGGGASVHYGSGNASGQQTNLVLQNSGFEVPILSEEEVREAPVEAGWSFSGSAGIYRKAQRSLLLTNELLGPSRNTLAQSCSLGFKFTTGPEPVGLYEMGRWAVLGNSSEHTIRLVRAADQALVASVTINTAEVTPGQYVFARVDPPVALAAQTSFYLVSSEADGGDAFHDGTTTADASAGITIDGSVRATYDTDALDISQWAFVLDGAPGTIYGPVNLRVAQIPTGTLEFPPDPPSGSQAGYIAGTGAVGQVIAFLETGVFALRFLAAAKLGQENGLRVYFDEQDITPNGDGTGEPNPDPGVPGGGWWAGQTFKNTGSLVFNVTSTGPHTIMLAGSGRSRSDSSEADPDPNRIVYLDRLEIASVDAVFAGGIPVPIPAQASEAVGPDPYSTQLNAQARYAEAFGLRVVAYEGGWSLAGAAKAEPLPNWAKDQDPRARQAQIDALNSFARSGGAMYTFGLDTTWPASDTAHVEAYPLTQGIDEHGSALPEEASHGTWIPAVLTPGCATWYLRAGIVTGAFKQTGGWLGWNVLAPESGAYEVVVETAGAGRARLFLDGEQVGVETETGSSFTNLVMLTRGLHNLRVQSANGSFRVPLVRVTEGGMTGAPVLESVVDDDATVMLSWSAPTNGLPVSYLIRYGTSPGVYEWLLQAGDTFSTTVTGLVNNTTYYFAVVARHAAGLSLPSQERAATPLAPYQQGTLAQWEFAGNTGQETVAPATASTSRLTVSPLIRGSGFMVTSYGQDIAGNSISSEVNNGSSTNLAQALAKGHYYEFVLAPVARHKLSLTEVMFQPYWQGHSGDAGVAYSIDSLSFTIIPATGGSIGWSGTKWTADLSGEPSLQNCSNPITLRLLQCGVQTYQYSGLGRGTGNDIEVRGHFSPWRSSAPPDLEPAPGTYTNEVTVTLRSTAPGAAIWFTTNGTIPSPLTGMPYTGPLIFSNTTDLRAIAWADGYDENLVTNAQYHIEIPSYWLIPTGAVWRYFDHGEQPAGDWRDRFYDDTDWASGPAPLGYGIDQAATPVSFGPDPDHKYITTYFRFGLVVNRADRWIDFTLHLWQDEGVVVYLNGTELWRSNMPDGAVDYSTTALTSNGPTAEINFVVERFDAELLLDGLNVVAVEVHQSSADSADLGFDFALEGRSRARPPPVRILPLGDSITQGGDGFASFRYLLWSKLRLGGPGGRGYDVDFVGTFTNVYHGDVPGNPDTNYYPDYYTSFDRDHDGFWAWRTDQVRAVVNEVARRTQPDIVLVYLGFNDVGQWGAAGVTNAQTNLVEIIDRLRAERPDVVVLLGQLNPIGPGSPYYENAGYVSVLNQVMADLAAATDRPQSRVMVVDHYTGYQTAEWNQKDGLHLNRGGESAVAQAWFAALEPILQRRNPPRPVIHRHPGAHQVNLGQDLTLSVGTAGLAPLRYQWRHDQVPIAGATNATLSIFRAGLDAAGEYDVLVSNPAGVIGSMPGTLIVNHLRTNVTLIAGDTPWRFHDRGEDLGSTWRELDYDDSSWSEGAPKFGYGRGDITTVLDYGADPANKHPTYYFRCPFVHTHTVSLLDLEARLIRDDGAIVYLNGTEIFRSNMPEEPAEYFTLAFTSVDGDDENCWWTNSVPLALLQPGTNVLAVEVHQAGPESSDLGFQLELTGLRLLHPVPPPPVLTARWDPRSDLLRLSFSCEFDRDYTVFTSTNLTDWIPLTNWHSDQTLLEFVDPPNRDDPVRFYRVQAE